MGFFNKLYTTVKWGELSLIALYISVISGIIIGMQYDPSTPWYSSSSIDTLIPYGLYLRSLHFYSSQIFFLFAILHFIAVYQQTDSYSTNLWLKLVASLPIGLLILFTGYILRGDTTGMSAGLIAENIILKIPLIGSTLNDLLFSISDYNLKKVYLNHIITLDIIWLLLLWNHLKKYTIKVNNNLFFTSAILLFSFFVAAPIEPESLGTTHIAGPWFFLGLQEMLKYTNPLFSGAILPALLMLAIALLRKSNKYYNQTLLFIIIWLVIYSIFTIYAWLGY